MQRRNFGPNTPFASPRLGARRVLKTSLLCRDLASASDAMPQRQRYTDCGTRTPRARGTVKIGHEAFSSVSINELLKDADWPLSDGRSVRFEPPLDHGGEAGCAPFERRGRVLAVLEAKRTSVDLSVGEAQGQRYDDLPLSSSRTARKSGFATRRAPPISAASITADLTAARSWQK